MRAPRSVVRRTALLAGLTAALVAGTGAAAAQDAPAPAVQVPPEEAVPDTLDTSRPGLSGRALDEQVREVSSQLRCVVCQGISIQDSPSELARQMKSVVRQQLAAGRSPDQVKQYFVGKYGEWILLSPEPEGFNLAVYVLPVVALVIGAVVVIVAVRRWTDAEPEPGEPDGRRPEDREADEARPRVGQGTTAR